MVQIDCTSWLAGVDHDGEGMMCVITRLADMHARSLLGNEEALKLLQRLGYAHNRVSDFLIVLCRLVFMTTLSSVCTSYESFLMKAFLQGASEAEQLRAGRRH